LDLPAGQIVPEQSIFQRGCPHFDAPALDEAAQKMSRRIAAVKERFAVGLHLLADEPPSGGPVR
jgi:hypothetical protein